MTDFGLTRKVDASVKYLEYVNQYHAPELCETVANEMLTVATSIDIWALGTVIGQNFNYFQITRDYSRVNGYQQ